jgi:CHAT domain-containing protein
LAKLQSLSPQIARISNHSITSEYYQVIGELQASTGHFAEAEAAFSKAMDMAEQELSSLNSEAQRLSWARQSALPYYNMIELKLRQGDNAAGLEVLERYRGAGLRRRSREPVTRSRRMADWISGRTSATNSTLLVYALLPRGPMIWILDDHGLQARRLPADVLVMIQTARSFLELCTARSGQMARTDYLGRVLYHMLVAPVEDQIRPQRALIIESDPELKFPFQALTDSQGRYLLEKAPIVYIPAASYFPELRHEQEISPDYSVVVGSNPAVGQYGLGSLPDVELEAREVAERLPHADLLLTKDATLEALRTRLGRATHFHFGGHAAQVKGTLGLLLGSPNSSAAADVLDASEVSRIPMRKLRLATLAACSTENGSDRGAGDAESLARAFLRAGVPHVVASRWNVESGPTRELMRLFYDQLKSGMAPARALAAAELQFSKVPGRESPYFWAGFDAFGYE